jgi:carbamoyl-phosphate synthase large subunit
VSSIRVLVTAIGGGGHGEQIVRALASRLDGAPQLTILGADRNPNVPQRSLVSEFIQLPSASDPSYFESLVSVISSRQIDMVFHGCEPEMHLMNQNAAELKTLGVATSLNEEKVVSLCQDKAGLDERLRQLGASPPRSRRLLSAADISDIDWFPVVVKPTLSSGGSKGVHLAQSPEELLALWVYLNTTTPCDPLVVQEYLGTPDQEFTIGVLSSRTGDVMSVTPMRRDLRGGLSLKLIERNVLGGPELGDFLALSTGVSQGWIGPFPEVASQAAQVARLLGSKGPLNLQARVDHGGLRVFEINPRLSGTTYLRTLAGVNEPMQLIRERVLGKDMEVETPNQVYVLRGLTEYVMPPGSH